MDDIEQLRKDLAPILKKYGIDRAGISGFTASDDYCLHEIDLLVKLNQNLNFLEFIAIQQEIEDALNMNVDLIEYDNFFPELREAIMKEGVPVA